jgi:hypothetical protein
VTKSIDKAFGDEFVSFDTRLLYRSSSIDRVAFAEI